jgi:hypothetical protein
MPKIPDHVLPKLEKLSEKVEKDLRNKGVVIPFKLPDGSVCLGSFKVLKSDQGFYSIENRNGDLMAKQINLPQTAILVANGMALGNILDHDLLAIDKNYGYAAFEEQLYKRAIEKYRKKNPDTAYLKSIKLEKSKKKKEQYKKEIVHHFEKLRKFS